MSSAGAGWSGRCQRKSPEIRSAEPWLGSAACGVRQWFVAGGRPARFGRVKRTRPPGRAELAAGLNRQPAEPDRDVHQRDPAGQHVLDAGHPVVVVDVPAARPGLRPLRVDGAQHLRGVGERFRPENAADHLPQRRQVRNLVERGAEHRGAERRVGERVHRVDRARLNRGYRPVIRPAAGLQLPEDRLTYRPDLGGRQQAAEEQVPVVGQAAAQPAAVIDQAARVGQLIHTLTISTGR
jgi:hypothetical protein